MPTITRFLTPRRALPVLLLAAAAAQAAPERDFYVGTTIGATAIKPDDHDAKTSQNAEARASLGLFAGARLGALPIGDGWPVYAEVGWQDIARHKVTYHVPGGSSELTARGHTAYAAAKMSVLNTGNFSLYGKLGVARSSVTASTPAGQPPIPISGSHTGLLVGFGAQYDFDNRISLRGELTSFGKTSAKSTGAGLSMGVAYRF